jgi:hypothetical protein
MFIWLLYRFWGKSKEWIQQFHDFTRQRGSPLHCIPKYSPQILKPFLSNEYFIMCVLHNDAVRSLLFYTAKQRHKSDKNHIILSARNTSFGIDVAGQKWLEEYTTIGRILGVSCVIIPTIHCTSFLEFSIRKEIQHTSRNIGIVQL